jgi:hypothetical protein
MSILTIGNAQEWLRPFKLLQTRTRLGDWAADSDSDSEEWNTSFSVAGGNKVPLRVFLDNRLFKTSRCPHGTGPDHSRPGPATRTGL